MELKILDNCITMYYNISDMKDKIITFRLSEEDKKKLEQDAKEQRRSVSNFIIWLWKEWRKEKGKEGG